MAEEGDERAQLARDMFNYRLKKYIGSYSAVLGRVDCIVFTGGIGENDSGVRLKSCENLENLGIKIDPVLNEMRSSEIMQISTPDSKVKVLVIDQTIPNQTNFCRQCSRGRQCQNTCTVNDVFKNTRCGSYSGTNSSFAFCWS